MKYPRLTTILFLYGNLVILCSFFVLLITMGILSFTGYRAVVDSNMFGEHYFEMFILISGLISYVITYNKVKIKRKELKKI